MCEAAQKPLVHPEVIFLQQHVLKSFILLTPQWLGNNYIFLS